MGAIFFGVLAKFFVTKAGKIVLIATIVMTLTSLIKSALKPALDQMKILLSDTALNSGFFQWVVKETYLDTTFSLFLSYLLAYIVYKLVSNALGNLFK